MFVTYVIVTVLAAVTSIGASVVDLLRADWVLGNMSNYGVPHSWLPALIVLKVAGGVGLLLGFWLPWLGLAAAIGLVLYFLGAVGTVLRARWYSDVFYPVPPLALAGGALAMRLLAG